MYIPSIFFGGGLNDCIECAFSGSFIPDGITFDKVNSDWAYLKIPAGKSVQFQTQYGITDSAKMLVIGGGGYSNSATTQPGGGGAGQVVFQDFATEPGINYFASASFGGNTTNTTGGRSVFIENYVANPSEWTEYEAVGGGTNTTTTGGSSGDGFSGGTGCGTGTSAGGGAGSTGNGGNADCGGTEEGGDGGDGFTIPAPFDSVVGFSKVAGGGPGSSNFQDGLWASGVSPSAYGNGGYDGDGNEGAVFIFLPITNCYNTGSREISFFRAQGGDVVGTFVTESVQYKYHAFLNGSSSLSGSDVFDVTSGVTYEAKTLILGGGAGSVTSEIEFASGPDEYCAQAGGGAGAGAPKFTDNVTFWGYGNRIGIGEGGPPFRRGFNSLINQFPYFTTTTADGGGKGAYNDPSVVPASAAAESGGSGGGGYTPVNINGGTATGNGIGNDGGDGASGFTTQTYAGGGGGGAGSAGTKANGTFDGSPIGDRYAKGGDGYDLSSTFWSFLTGSVYTSRSDIAIGGSGSAGVYSSGTAPHTCGTLPAGGYNLSQDNDGSGANPYPTGTQRGKDGIVVIVYPISGSTANSGI